jgi:hypothetical protein
MTCSGFIKEFSSAPNPDDSFPVIFTHIIDLINPPSPRYRHPSEGWDPRRILKAGKTHTERIRATGSLIRVEHSPLGSWNGIANSEFLCSQIPFSDSQPFPLVLRQARFPLIIPYYVAGVHARLLRDAEKSAPGNRII